MRWSTKSPKSIAEKTRSTCTSPEPFWSASACALIGVKFVERKPPARTSNPFTTPEPVLDAGEVLERIATVKEENLKRLDDDIDILKSYLKTQNAPKTAIEALEGVTVAQHVSWKKGHGSDQETAGGIGLC
jgi:hypothetical protein